MWKSKKCDFDIVNSEEFVEHYMGASRESLAFQNSPIQIYPLSIASSLLKIPTPFFRAEYNFLLIFSSGGGVQQVYNEIFHLTSNDILFVREGHLNAIKSISPNTEGFFIHIDSAFLPQIFSDRTLLNRLTFNPKVSVSNSDINWLCNCANLMHETNPNTKNAIEVNTTLLRSMILKLNDIQQIELKPKLDRPSEVNLLFKELLYNNFREKRDVQFYARSLSVSESYLNRCVKTITNKAPKQHINEVIIYYSQILLQNSTKDISQIAFELNFSDPSYFGRLFKLVTGSTPSEYRSTISQDLSDHQRVFS